MRIQEWWTAWRAMTQTGALEDAAHLKLAGSWLLKAQEAGSGGYAHSYSLVHGWRPAYAETTGYILDSLFHLTDFLKDSVYRDSALRAAQWLLIIQNADGSFNGLSGTPFVFDTGQILDGFLKTFERTKDEKFLSAAVKAGDWLVRQQESDGRWVRGAYLETPHSYYVKVAAPLLALTAASGKETYRQAALKNIQWTLAQQQPNGFFRNAAFGPDETPFLHTIVYVLEGLIDCCKAAPENRLVEGITSLAQALLATEKRDGLLYSRYAENWRPALKQKCMVGLAQWAKVTVELSRLIRNRAFIGSAQMNIAYLKSKQVRSAGSLLDGALPASLPFWGRYNPYSFINWGVKYFIDALLAGMDPALHPGA